MTKYLLLIAVLFISNIATGQIDPTLLKRIPNDTVKPSLSMDAIYNRPFVVSGNMPVSIGGYLESNWQHVATDGISEGHQFQFRRMTLFVSSAIGKRLKFLSEIEFEDGTKEISIEFAALDFELHPLLNIRSGMILNPIGAFNQNHDGPKWEFTDRPIASTQMLPATWSNAGVGFYGKHYNNAWMFGYEAYISGNFDNTIIDNTENKTFLPATKNKKDRFDEINSGLPLLTTKVAIRNNKVGEIGFSYMGGVYNKFLQDGLLLDDKRRVDVIALDFNTTLAKSRTFITGEWAWIFVSVPSTYTQQYGNQQQGGFLDVVQPVVRRKMMGWPNATLNLACRIEYVDWNVGKFTNTGSNIAEDLYSIMPAISFRPSALTVLRLNYRYQLQRDILGNPPRKTGGFNIGVSTYF